MIVPAVLLLPLGLTGCGKLFSIRIEETSETVVPEGTLVEALAGQLGFGSFVSMDISDNQELQNQGVEPGDIQDVELTYIELEAVDPDGSDLSFIDSLEVYVEAPDLPQVLIASQDDFPAGEAVVDMELEAVDLTDYAVSQSMTITTDATGGRPEEETTVRATIGLKVGVTGQGITRKRD